MRLRKLSLAFCLTLCLLLGAVPSCAQIFRNPVRLATKGSPTLVLTADLNGDGRLDIVYGYGSEVHVLLRTSAGTYTDVQTLSVGMPPYCLLADLDGNRTSDLVCANYGTANSAVVFLGHGDGTFGAPIESPQPTRNGNSATYTVVGVGDLNNDGFTDVLLSDRANGSTINALMGNGTGAFTLGPQRSTGTNIEHAIVTDLNGDGKRDLFTTGVDGAAVFPGVGDGSFSDALQVLPPGILQDVDGDGRLDLVGAGRTLLILHGNGDGTFNTAAPLASITVPPGTSANLTEVLAYQDVDGDGIPDILAGGGNGLIVLHGAPAYQFSVTHHYATGVDFTTSDYFHTGVVVDLDGDGHADFLGGGPFGLDLTYGNGDGTFRSAPVYESGGSVTNTTVADFNGDGIPDVVTTGDTLLNIAFGNGDGTFRPSTAIAGSNVFASAYYANAFLSMVHGDFNGDGHQDILVVGSTSFYDRQGYVLLGKGDGTFGGPIATSPTLKFIDQKSVSDLNGDGRDDITFTDPYGTVTNLFIGLARPDGTFTVQTINYSGSNWAFGDIDADGRPDLLSVEHSSTPAILVTHGNGDGTFGPATIRIPVPTDSLYDMVAGDFDGDGHPDIATLSTVTSTAGSFAPVENQSLDCFYGDGGSNFARVSTPIVANGYTRLAVADLNGDQRDDLYYTNQFGNTFFDHGTNLGFVRGNADRTLSPETYVVLGVGLQSTTAIDLNGDGRTDFLAGNGPDANSFTVALNDGDVPMVTGTLTASPEPSKIQTSFELTATLRPPPANSNTVLVGNITFAIDGSTVGTATLVGNIATLSVGATLTRGSHALAAAWPGQPAAGNAPALGALTLVATHTVIGAPSSTTLAASAVAVSANTPITFSAITTEQGGTVPDLTKLQILDGTLALTPVVTVSANSVAVTATLTPGIHTLTALFAGDTAAEPSTSAPVSVTVAPYPDTLTLGNLSGYAFQNLTVLGAVHFSPQPSSSPGGTVVFSTGSQILGSFSLDPASSTAGLVLNLAAGTYPIHAVYTPIAAGYAPATADAVVTIGRAAVALSFTSPLIPAAAPPSKPITLTAMFDDGTNHHLATGGIIPSVDGVPQTPLPLPLASLTLAYTATGLLPGTHSVSLTYPGDSNFLPSTTATAILTVLNRDFLFSGDQTLAVPTQHYRSLPVTLSSVGDFSGSVNLSCVNLPPTASCRFSQPAVTLAAGASTTFQLTVETSALPGYLATNDADTSHRKLVAAGSAPFALLTLVLATRRRRQLRSLTLLLAVLLFAGAVLTGCSGRYPAFTPPGTYTIQVVGQSADTGGTTAAISHSRPITLTVTQ